MLCQLVVQPVIRLIHVVVAAIKFVIEAICRLVEQLVEVVVQVLRYICNTVVRTVCNAVCSVICGICDFFCGIFGCDCGCRNVCNNVCKTVTDVVCGWTYVLETVLQFVTRLVCNYILKAIIVLLDLIVAVVSMILTWVCALIDWIIRWFLCWTYIAEIFNSTRQRRFKVAPKIVPNAEGHSDWFVYVANKSAAGVVPQNVRGYVLSDRGRPLVPVVDRVTKAVSFLEVETRGDVITGRLRRKGREPVAGRPLLYYPYKVMEIASHLFGDIFGGSPADDGTGTTPDKNLFTYDPAVQARLANLAANTYCDWTDKYSNPSSGTYFGDRSLPDMGIRVDTDDTCSRPTNTFLHLVHDIVLAPGNTDVAEEMTCGAGQTLTFAQTDYLMSHKDDDVCAVTTYFVTRYEHGSGFAGCNDLLGYTSTSFENCIVAKVLEYTAQREVMMARIADNVAGRNPEIVRVAETYLHELGHQSGLLHDEDLPDCHDATTLDISKLMDPDASVRRALTRWQWCMIRGTCYCTPASLTPFLQAPELEHGREEHEKPEEPERPEEPGEPEPIG
jgi:hypothetical protein